jgi:hypothetical protein
MSSRSSSFSQVTPGGSRVTWSGGLSKVVVSEQPRMPGPQAPRGERNTRAIPQDVKIAVAARDHGRCRQCGSMEDLHYDHVIPWSRGGRIQSTTSNSCVVPATGARVLMTYRPFPDSPSAVTPKTATNGLGHCCSEMNTRSASSQGRPGSARMIPDDATDRHAALPG